MTKNDLSLNYISTLNISVIAEVIHDRIVGKSQINILTGSGHDTEYPIDLVIELLKNRELSGEIRAAVIAGCRKVYEELHDNLERGALSEDELSNLSALCRIMDLTCPSELEQFARDFFDIAFGNDSLRNNRFVLCPVICAWLGYANLKDIPRLKEMLQNQLSAAYAFNGILRISPELLDLENTLYNLWRNQIVNSWKIDCKYLALRASESLQCDREIGKVVSRMKNQLENEEFARLRQELDKHEWSRKWLLYI